MHICGNPAWAGEKHQPNTWNAKRYVHQGTRQLRSGEQTTCVTSGTRWIGSRDGHIKVCSTKD